MKRIRLYIAVSLDGFIARPDGDLDWLIQFPNPSGTDHGYNELLQSVDTLIMGGATYRWLLNEGSEWPYKDQTTYVVSHQKGSPSESIRFISQQVVETIRQMKAGGGKDIWLVGGGQVITLLLNEDLIDEMQICYIPIILGNGIPLFPDRPKESHWKVTAQELYDSGILKINFNKITR